MMTVNLSAGSFSRVFPPQYPHGSLFRARARAFALFPFREAVPDLRNINVQQFFKRLSVPESFAGSYFSRFQKREKNETTSGTEARTRCESALINTSGFLHSADALVARTTLKLVSNSSSFHLVL